MSCNDTTEALKIAKALEPMAKAWFDKWGKSAVRDKKMVCTTAPVAGVIGVSEAYGNEIVVPYAPNFDTTVSVSDPVRVAWFYDNLSTAMAYYPQKECANLVHSHGNIANNGAIGTTANLPLFTGAGGVIETKTAADGLAALGGISTNLLWTNASPKSAFVAQTLTLTLSGYSALVVVLYDKATASSQLSQIIPISGASKLIAFELTDTASWYSQLYSRIVTVTGNSVVFGSGYYATEAKAKTQNDATIIPVRIYGIKGVS